jgi:hypothetical protein
VNSLINPLIEAELQWGNFAVTGPKAELAGSPGQRRIEGPAAQCKIII